MQFVKTENLKTGMRLARPIFSKKGVLLFERDSHLSQQAIDSVKNFGLLGIYVLEPAEPLPPMSEEDMESERFQTMTVANIQEELENMVATKKSGRIDTVVNMVIRNYGHFDGKVNFYQNLRSREDYVYRHSLNVAVLCALITHTMNMKVDERTQAVCAAVVHDVGKLGLPGGLVYGEDLSEEDAVKVYQAQLLSGDLIEEAFSGGTMLKRICMQAMRKQLDAQKGDGGDLKMLPAAKVLQVANRYDELTAMSLSGHAKSEVRAVQEFLDHPEIYDGKVVEALIHSINILFAGVSVELSTGDKALVLQENPENILRPVVLCFKDNTILDLSLPGNRDIQILDIMKTMDNRCIMDTNALRQAGFQADPPETGQ